MDINIRDYIKNNFKDSDENEIKNSIDMSTNESEVVLPGLGVLFEILWANSSKEEKANILTKIKSGL